MRYFIAILSVCLIGVDAHAVRTSTSTEQAEEKPPTIHQLLVPLATEAKPQSKSKRKQQEYERRRNVAEEDRIKHLCNISAEEWCEFSRELQETSSFGKYINLEDRGLVGVLEAMKILENLTNHTFDLMNPQTKVGNVLLMFALGAEFKQKHACVTELNKAYERKSTLSMAEQVGLCLRFAKACLDYADALPSRDLNVEGAVTLIASVPQFAPTLQVITEAGLQSTIPENFFDMDRRFYYRKAALHFYQARFLACMKFLKDDVTWGHFALQCSSLKYSELIDILRYINSRIFVEDAWEGEFFSLSLLLNKAVLTFYTSPDFKEAVSVSKQTKQKKGRGKNGRRKKKYAASPVTERELSEDQKRERVQTIQGLLMEHVDPLRNGGRGMEAEYRERAAFLICALPYKDEMNTGGVTLLSEGKKFTHIERAMKNVDELREVLESVAHIEGPILAYNALKRYYTNQLLKLCDRLHGEEFACVPDEIKFGYYQQFRMIQEKGYFNSPGESQATNDYIGVLIFNMAARVAPDQTTETDYYQKAASLLCPTTEGLDLYAYYKKLCAREFSNQDLSKRKRKRLNEQTIPERAAVRTLVHLHLLSRIGREDEIGCLLQTLQTRGEAEQTANRETRRNKHLTHVEIVERIRAEQATREAERAAEEALRQKIEAQAPALQQTEAAASYPYWYTLHEDGETVPQAQIRQEIREAQEQREAKKARKAQARAARTEGVGSASSAEEDEAQISDVTPAIPPFVREALEAHRDTFEALFTRHEGEGAYDNAISVQRDGFLRLILALGGTHSCNQGRGSHQFVRLVLGDQVVDMEALPDDLAGELERRITASNSRGTMTLSWPKKDRGHNRRFLLPEQIKNARLILAANGLTPQLVFGGDEGPAGEDGQDESAS